MYDELVKRLRSEAVYLPEKFSKNAELLDVLMKAADAIEELQKAVLRLEDESGILDELPMYQQPVGWIPVAERLPDERKWVLCQCRAKIRMVLRLQNGYWHQDSQHEFMSGFVTHWMPLPGPPKED